MVREIPILDVAEPPDVAVEEAEVRPAAVEVGMGEVGGPDPGNVLRIEKPEHRGRPRNRGQLHRVVLGSSAVVLLVEAIMKEIEAAAPSRIRRAYPQRTARRHTGIRALRHFVIRRDPYRVRQMKIPAVRELTHRGGIREAFRRQEIVVFSDIKLRRQPPLLEVVQAVSGVRLLPRALKGRQQQRRQDSDNRYHHQQLNQCKPSRDSHFPFDP